MRRSNCAGALQYVPELTWILFLRILDEREAREAEEAEAVRADSRRRWSRLSLAGLGHPGRGETTELQNGAFGAFFGFVNGELHPYLRGLANGRTPPRARRSSAKSSPASNRAHRHRAEFARRARQGAGDHRGPSIRRTSSRSRRSTRACSSKWGRRGTTAASSSPRAKSSGPWCGPSTRGPARRCMIPAAEPAAFSSKRSNT